MGDKSDHWKPIAVEQRFCANCHYHEYRRYWWPCSICSRCPATQEQPTCECGHYEWVVDDIWFGRQTGRVEGNECGRCGDLLLPEGHIRPGAAAEAAERTDDV